MMNLINLKEKKWLLNWKRIIILSNFSPLKKQQSLLDYIPIRCVNGLTRKRSYAIKHLPAKEDLIKLTWKKCAQLIILTQWNPLLKKQIFSMPVYHLKNKWTTLIDKLSISKIEDPSMLHIILLKIVLQELTSKDQDYSKFWTSVHKEISAKLLWPIKTDLLDSDLNCSRFSSKKTEVVSKLLTKKSTKVQNKNLQMISCPLSTSIVADKWVNEDITEKNQTQLKALRIQLKTNPAQRKIIDEWINTSRAIYNKTLKDIKNGTKINFIQLRDKFVTYETKKTNDKYIKYSEKITKYKKKLKNLKDEEDIIKIKKKIERNTEKFKEAKKNMNSIINNNIAAWELKTPKETRAAAVNDVCKAYKTAFINFKNGNIKYFEIKYKKKKEKQQTILLQKNMIKNNNGILEMRFII